MYRDDRAPCGRIGGRNWRFACTISVSDTELWYNRAPVNAQRRMTPRKVINVPACSGRRDLKELFDGTARDRTMTLQHLGGVSTSDSWQYTPTESLDLGRRLTRRGTLVASVFGWM